ncbi:mucin-17-like isoform X2 [Lepisosteus oculatus]|uniref:mucin-17-like isoform X2 n=1 Tax=Lepisosteus oculatus TaxID=7918 RepID=UPI0037186F34
MVFNSFKPQWAPLSSLRPLLLETFFWSCLMCSHITVGPHSCNSVRVFRGIPDKEVNAGTVFFHPIPPVAFHGPVKDYEVSLAGTIDKLPRWLDYNPQTQSLQGLAVSEERGDYTIAVTAVGHCRQEPSPSTHFHLHVLNGTHSLKARSLRRLDWRNKHTKSSQGCPAGETVTYSAIILQADVFSLSAGRRLLLVSTMGEYLRLDPFSLKLRSFRSPSELQLENSTLLTEDTGIGDSPDTHAAVEVYWPVGCGDFQMVSELVRVLRYSKDSGHLSHLLGLHLTGWRVFTWGGGGSQHRRRERRQLINTPTPVMTPVAPTYVSATLPIKLSYSYMGMTTISTYVRDTEIINNEGYPTGISTSMGSTTRSSEDKKKDVSSALKSELTRPNEEFSTMYLRLCPSGLFTPDYLAEDLKISTTDTGHMTIATRIMVGQSQETSLLSQMSPLQTSSQTIQSYYSPAVLCSVFLAYSSDLNLMGLESQHVKSISLQTVLSRSETSELVIEPEFSSTGTHIKLTSKPFIDLLTPPAEDSWPMLHSEDVATTSYQVMLGKSTMSTSSVQQSWHTAAFQMQRTSVLSSTSSTVSVVLVAAPGTPMTQVYYTDTDSISLFPTLTRKDAPESILMAPDSENLFKRTSTIPTKSAQSHQDTETIGQDAFSQGSSRENQSAHSERPLQSPLVSRHSSLEALLTDALTVRTPSMMHSAIGPAEFEEDGITETHDHSMLLLSPATSFPIITESPFPFFGEVSQDIGLLKDYSVDTIALPSQDAPHLRLSSVLEPSLLLIAVSYNDFVLSRLSDSVTIQTKAMPPPSTSENPESWLDLTPIPYPSTPSLSPEVDPPQLVQPVSEVTRLCERLDATPSLPFIEMTSSKLVRYSFHSILDDSKQPATPQGTISLTRTHIEELEKSVSEDFVTKSFWLQMQSRTPSCCVSITPSLPSGHILLTPRTAATTPMDMFRPLKTLDHLTSFYIYHFPSVSTRLKEDETTNPDLESSLTKPATGAESFIPVLTPAVEVAAPSPTEGVSILTSPTEVPTFYTATRVPAVPETPRTLPRTLSILNLVPTSLNQQQISFGFTSTYFWQITSESSVTPPIRIPVSSQSNTHFTRFSLPLSAVPANYTLLNPGVSSTSMLQIEDIRLSSLHGSFSFLTLGPVTYTSGQLPSLVSAILGETTKSYSSVKDILFTTQLPSLLPGNADIPNISPFVLRPIKPLIATIGLLFEFSIPADTFSDPEDGTADNLTMKIRPSDGSPSGPESWLTLDHKQRLLSGYPLDSDMLFSPQELLLIARDSGGLSAELPFTIELRHPLSEPCHTYTIRTMNSFHSFVKDRRKIELFLDKMAKYFNDTGSSHISVSTLQPGSTVVSWHNVTLCQEDKKAQSLCPKHKIQGLLSAMQTLEGDVEPSFAQAMLPEFRIRSVGNVTYGGMCLRGSDLEYPSPTGAIAHSDRYRWIPTLVIALLTVLGLFLSLVLMAAIFRSCKACECIIRSESISLWPSDRPSCSSCHLELDTLKPRKPPLFLQNIPPPPQQLWVNLSHPPQERLHRRPLTHTQRPYQRSTVPSQSPPRYQLPPPYVLKDQPPQRNSSQ